jgi:holo-[acyl-carrier protein] synthase
MSTYGIGLDLVAVARVERLLTHHGGRGVARLLTDAERDYCMKMAVPARHVAARIAAKEAVYKALQGSEDARGIGWREIEVVRGVDGRPAIRLSGSAARRLETLGATQVLVSLTHTDELAAAVALVV